jgi:hypothetical protein
MNYKTIIMCTLLAGTMHHTWAMEQPNQHLSAINGYAALMRAQTKCTQAGVPIMRQANTPAEFLTIIPQVLAFKQDAAKASLAEGPRRLAQAGELAQQLEDALEQYLKNKEAANNKDAKQ